MPRWLSAPACGRWGNRWIYLLFNAPRITGQPVARPHTRQLGPASKLRKHAAKLHPPALLCDHRMTSTTSEHTAPRARRRRKWGARRPSEARERGLVVVYSAAAACGDS